MNKRISLNLIGQIVAFFCSLGISFFITPIVVNNLGSEVYGFVGLANNFTSYITLFTVAITSMLSRYVTISYAKKEYKKASEYFSTAVITQTILAFFLLILGLLFISKMENFINISPENIFDVKILWTLIFISFLLNLPLGCYSVASFAKNRLDIQAIVIVASNVIRAGTLAIAFIFFTPKVWYVGLATILSNQITIIGNYLIAKKYTPEIQLSIKYFKRKSIYELVVVGIWNSVSRLGQILRTGLDLLLSNLFISGTEMGIFSIAKTVPAQLGNLAGSILNAFEPSMTIAYATAKKENFIESILYAMKMNGFICAVPILGVISFGRAFYRLWMPSLTTAELDKIQILTIITLTAQVLEVYMQPLYTVNTITKKLKLPVLVNLGTGILNAVLALIFLNLTNWGVYIIAVIGSVIYIIRIFTFMPIYAAYCVGVKWNYFYRVLFRGIINFIIIAGIYYLLSSFFAIDSWIMLILVAGFCGIIGYIISFVVSFNSSERAKLLSQIKYKFSMCNNWKE
mgnify:CR=1 FL=1